MVSRVWSMMRCVWRAGLELPRKSSLRTPSSGLLPIYSSFPVVSGALWPTWGN